MFMCPKCGEWQVKNRDRFCSWCGIKLFDIEVKPQKIRFYTDRVKGKCLHKNRIVLNNRGLVEVGPIGIAYDNKLFGISGEVEVLKQGEEKTLAVDLLQADNIEAFEPAIILIEVGEKKYPIRTECYYAPEWTLKLQEEDVKPGEVKAIYQRPGNTEVRFRLEKSVKTIFEIEDVFIEDERYAVEITERGEYYIAGLLKLDSEHFSPGRDEFVEFVVKGKDTDSVGRISFYVSLRVPPDFLLMLEGKPVKEGRKEEITIYEGIENEIELKIINNSTEYLAIEGIDADPPFDLQEMDVTFPRQLLPDSHQVVHLKLDPHIMAGSRNDASLLINTREIKGKRIDFLIDKKLARSFTGTLAVDFGTTNNTIAYRTAGRTRFVPLEKFSNLKEPALSPSVIRYDKVVDNKPEKYVIGELARSLMIDFPRSWVMSVKTRLGENEKIRILPVDESSGPAEFIPSEVTFHIIRRLIKIAESFLKKKVSGAVISHPSKFTDDQVKALKTAFWKSEIDILDVIEEPEATAINYIIKKKKKTDKERSYVIGVFDCGGGTTDITMIEVFEKENEGQRVLNVKVLVTDGNRNFGGNNMTEIMMDILVGKIKNRQMLFKETDVDDKGLKFFYTPEDEKNEKMIKIMASRTIEWEVEVRRIRDALWRFAEDCKIELSRVDASSVKKETSLSFITAEEKIEKFDVTFNIKRKEFEEKIKDIFLDFLDKMKRMEKKTGKNFDLIMLSGMSSKIPLVYRVFSRQFGDKVRYADDLKKCVARGAIEYYEKKNIPGSIILKFDRIAQLRSAIGVQCVGEEGNLEFLEVFPQGTAIPTKKVKVDIPLKRPLIITVLLNLGTRENIEEAPDEFEEIKKIPIPIPKNIDSKKLKTGAISLQVDEKQNPKIFVRVGNFKEEF